MGALRGANVVGWERNRKRIIDANRYIWAMRLFILQLFCLLSCFSQGQSGIDVLNKVHVQRNTSLDPMFKITSESVYPISLGAPVALFIGGALKNDSELKSKAFTCASALVVASGTSLLLKYVINRPRPYATHPQIQPQLSSGPYSMPSGHSTVAFATATSLSLAIPRWYVAVPSYAWAGMVAYSRMHLGMHYPGDVAAGALIGSGCAVASYYLTQWIRTKK